MEKEMMREDMKVEGFYAQDIVKLQTQINKFLKDNPDIDIQDLKYAHSCDQTGDQLFSALILYK